MGRRGGFVEHLSPTQVAQQSVTTIISMSNMNLVTPKAGTKRELVIRQNGLRVYLHVQFQCISIGEAC
jgi:hypothetical protein